MKSLRLFLMAAIACVVSGAAAAHAFLASSVPASGAKVPEMPKQVSLSFDSELEPHFSQVSIKDDTGRQVSAGNGDVSEVDRKRLVARIDIAGSAPAKGRYHVHWDVVSHDGHRSTGDFEFTLQ